MDTAELRRNPAAAAEKLRQLLDGRSQPFWVTESGAGQRPKIVIECEDLALVHALDDFLVACVHSHGF